MTLRRADETKTVYDLEEALGWLGDTPQDLLDALPDEEAATIRHAFNTHRVDNGNAPLAAGQPLPDGAFRVIDPLDHTSLGLPAVIDHLLDAGPNEYLRLNAEEGDPNSPPGYKLVQLNPEKGY